MKSSSRFFLLFLAGILSISFLANSCKQPGKPKVVITVIRVAEDNQQWPVSFAEVRLKLPEGASLPQWIGYANNPKFTDINGQVEYEFDYEGIVTFQATQGSGAESCGLGFARLVEGEISYETIRLSACYE